MSSGASAATETLDGLAGMAAVGSDISIAVSPKGLVEQIQWNVEGAPEPDKSSVIGAAIEDLVTEECRGKVREMILDALDAKAPRWREINLLLEPIGELPVRAQGIVAGNQVIFVARELRAVSALQQRLLEAQRALDEDYGRLRQLQTRYRVLFQTSSEPLLIADGKTRRIQEANAAAGRLLGVDAGELAGQSLDSLFAERDRANIRGLADRVIASGTAEAVTGRADDAAITVDCQLTVFRAVDQIMLLCRLTPGANDSSDTPQIEQLLRSMVDRIPDAVVLTGEGGEVLWCNEAFLGLAEVALASQARGMDLARFIDRPGVDVGVIIENVLEHGRLRAFASVLSGSFGSETKVEISVAVLPDANPRVVGFVMRDISRYDQMPSRNNGASVETQDQMMSLVGTVPLKELVRASTEEIEKICIEAALQKTGNNRASAAEMLGLSRQSLYVKLRRFGLVGS
ncbi:MAG: transcriptional regulator PpsR [Paracoccaceae bacterium]